MLDGGSRIEAAAVLKPVRKPTAGRKRKWRRFFSKERKVERGNANM